MTASSTPRDTHQPLPTSAGLEGDDRQALVKLIAAGCGSDTDGGSDHADLGPTIPVGAPR